LDDPCGGVSLLLLSFGEAIALNTLVVQDSDGPRDFLKEYQLSTISEVDMIKTFVGTEGYYAEDCRHDVTNESAGEGSSTERVALWWSRF
jgi:hypothetical protein